MTQRQMCRTCSLPKPPTKLGCRAHASDLPPHTDTVDDRIPIDRNLGLAMNQGQPLVLEGR